MWITNGWFWILRATLSKYQLVWLVDCKWVSVVPRGIEEGSIQGIMELGMDLGCSTAHTHPFSMLFRNSYIDEGKQAARETL